MFYVLVCPGGRGVMSRHHNFVVYALMITQLGKDMELDAFYTMKTKHW